MAGEEGGRGKACDAACIASGLDPDRIGRNTGATRTTIQLDSAFSAVDAENIGRILRGLAGDDRAAGSPLATSRPWPTISGLSATAAGSASSTPSTTGRGAKPHSLRPYPWARMQASKAGLPRTGDALLAVFWFRQVPAASSSAAIPCSEPTGLPSRR